MCKTLKQGAPHTTQMLVIVMWRKKSAKGEKLRSKLYSGGKK